MLWQHQILAGASGATAAGGGPDHEGYPVGGYTGRWRAQSNAVTVSGTAVSQWDNLGSAGSDWDATQSTEVNKPTFNESSENMNSKPSLSFDATGYTANSDYLDTGEKDGSDLIATDQFTIYVALFQEADSGNTGHNTGTYWATPGQYWGMFAGVTNHMYGSGYEHVSVTVANDSLVCMEWRYDGSTQYFTVAGVGALVGSTTDSASNIGSLTYGTNTYVIGAGGVGGNSGSGSSGDFDGEIGEMIFYNTHLGSSDRTTNRNYFATNYGVTWS